MHLFNPCRRWLSILVLAWAVLPKAWAEQVTSTPDYDLHYVAFNTMMVTPEVASTYGFTRARNRALVNISVIEKATGKPTSASITGTRKNLVGQVYLLDFQQVVEQDDIYYIAEMRFSEAEYWRFDIKVQPDPFKSALPLKFNQTFFIEQSGQ